MARPRERPQERRFDPVFLADLRDRTPLAELIGRSVDLRRSGRTQVGCCPFHGERTPSFHVYKDHFNCYGCGARGDAIEFVQQRDRVPFPEAVSRLAAEAGMDLPGAKPRAATPEERARQEAAAAERARQLDARRAAAERADAEREAFIARKAAAIWAKSAPVPADHPYLARKGVEPYDLRVDRKGNLLVPLRDDDGKLWNLQTISPDGKKLTLWRKTPDGPEGGRTKGLSYTIGSLDGAPAAVVAEGFATAASIRADTGLPTRMAFSGGNLLPVVQGLRERRPGMPILIGADNDHQAPRKAPPRVNQGLAKAEEAAAAVPGVRVVAPSFEAADPGKDWNDHRAKHGPGSLAPHFQAALAAPTTEQKQMPPEIPIAPGKPPIHSLDEMRDMVAQVQERSAAPMTQAAAATPPLAPPPATTVREVVAQAEQAAAGNGRAETIVGRLAEDLRRRPEIEDTREFRSRVASAVQRLDRIGVQVAVAEPLRAELAAARTAGPLARDTQSLRDRPDTGPAQPPRGGDAGRAQQQDPTPAGQPQTQQVQGPARRPSPVGTAVGGALASIFAALRPPQPDTPPPWQEKPHPLGDRLREYEERRAATVTGNLQHAAEQAGERARRALESLSQGPGSAVLAQIKQAAAGDPDGMRGVVAGMQPGGKYADLRSAFNDALVRERAFSNAFDRAVGGIAEYGTARVKLNEGLAARRMDTAVLDKQFGEMDREIGQAAETLPGRKSGQSAYDELAAKARKLAEFFADVIERAKNAIRPAEAPGQAPGQTPAPKAAPAPAMAPTM